MKNKGLFTVRDFATFSRTTRDTLLYYDKIDLLHPDARGENNYRYYSTSKLAVVNVIRTLQLLGIPLEEIKGIRDNRSPAFVNELYAQQIENIDKKIESWARAQKLLFTLKNIINSVMDIDENAITVEFLPATAIIIGDLNDYSRGKNDYDALNCFYHTMSDRYPDLDLNYPVWGLFSKERVEQGDFVWPDRYYFYNPEGRDRRPAGLYAVGYTRGGYGQSGDIYDRLTEYIDANGYVICGDAYEEYPLNEICIVNDNNYLMRSLIAVEKK